MSSCRLQPTASISSNLSLQTAWFVMIKQFLTLSPARARRTSSSRTLLVSNCLIRLQSTECTPQVTKCKSLVSTNSPLLSLPVASFCRLGS